MSLPISIIEQRTLHFYLELGIRMERRGDRLQAEVLLKRALHLAEQLYGQLHGEVGLVLLALSRNLKVNGKAYEAAELDRWIDRIVQVYQLDVTETRTEYEYSNDKPEARCSRRTAQRSLHRRRHHSIASGQGYRTVLRIH